MKKKDNQKDTNKDIEKKVEEWVEQKITAKVEIVGEIIAIILSFVFIWAAHNVTKWDYPIFDFIKEDFSQILWAIDLSVGVSIITKIIRILFPDEQSKKVTQIVNSCFSVVLLIVTLKVFPYDFTEMVDIFWINTAFKFLLWIGVLGAIIGIIVDMVKLVLGRVQEVT